MTTPPESQLPSAVWAALDDHQDAQRVMLGRILSELQRVATASDSGGGGSSSSANGRSIDAAPECDDETLLRFNLEDLSPGAAIDHATSLLEGESKLAPSTLGAIFGAATEVLLREPTVLDFSTASAVHVVGDLHGDAPSLLQVLELSGAPSEERNVLVFNGDFVDRGASGTEVLASLALLKIAHPGSVALLRGNHEDALLATVYGFKDELSSKYGDEHTAAVLWPAAVELFAALPIAAKTAEAFIVHGGLPSDCFSIAQLEAISPADRAALSSVLPSEGSEGSCARADAAVIDVVRGVLWSDPASGRGHVGVENNASRGGAGSLFAEDVTRAFLAAHGLLRVVRSHQCVENGVERHECGDGGGGGGGGAAEAATTAELFTVFSASCYPNGEGSNKGAVLRLRPGRPAEPLLFGGSTGCDVTAARREAAARRSLGALIHSHAGRLREGFERCARADAAAAAVSKGRPVKPGTRVAISDWVGVMSSTLSLHIDWAALQPNLAPAILRASVGSSIDDPTEASTGLVDYERFLASPLVRGEGVATPPDASRGSPGGGVADVAARRAREAEVLYQNMGALRAVFEHLDTDHNGAVSRQEFRNGLALLNSRLPEGQQLGGDEEAVDALFDAVDTDHSGEISLGELTEAFRLTGAGST